MAKAHADNLQHIFNKLGAALRQVLPHARVSTAAPAAEVDDEVVELSVSSTKALRVYAVSGGGSGGAIETHDAVQATGEMMKTGGKAWNGVPTAVAAGDNAEFATDLTQSQRVYLSESLQHDNDSVGSWEEPPSTGQPGSTAISNAAATFLNGGVSIDDCIYVDVQNNGTGWMRTCIGTATAATGIVLQPGDIHRWFVDDVASISNWAQNLNDPCGWAIARRP